MKQSLSGAVLVASLIGGGSIVSGCAKHLEILSRTEIRGTINDSPLQVQVASTIDVDHGGHSSCDYLRTPTGFNPGTLATLA